MTSIARFLIEPSLMHITTTTTSIASYRNRRDSRPFLTDNSFAGRKCGLSRRFNRSSDPKGTTLIPFILLPLSKIHPEIRTRRIGDRNQTTKMNTFVKTSLVIVAMLVVQVVFAGSQILTNLALKKQGFLLALLAYRHLIAAVCILPIALVFDRKQISKLKEPRVWFWAFLTALTGITVGMGLFYYGVRDTSAAYATNYSNLIPIITFLFSVIIRMEKLEISTLWGKAKGIGVVVCVGGALLISLYRGPSLVISSHNAGDHKNLIQKPYANLLRGTLLLIASCFGYAFWFVVQAKLLKVLPSKHWSTFLTCLVAAVQCAVLGICLDHSRSSWTFGWDVKLLCVTFSGIFASALAFYLILWGVQLKDPSYPSMFDPFSVVFVALIQAFFFGDQLTLGLLLGMVLMIIGLYCYLWGKRKEDQLSAAKASPCELQLPTTVADLTNNPSVKLGTT